MNLDIQERLIANRFIANPESITDVELDLLCARGFNYDVKMSDKAIYKSRILLSGKKVYDLQIVGGITMLEVMTWAEAYCKEHKVFLDLRSDGGAGLFRDSEDNAVELEFGRDWLQAIRRLFVTVRLKE